MLAPIIVVFNVVIEHTSLLHYRRAVILSLNGANRFVSFGQHLQLMGVLAVFIQDRMKESDYSGSLIKAILEVSSSDLLLGPPLT